VITKKESVPSQGKSWVRLCKFNGECLTLFDNDVRPTVC